MVSSRVEKAWKDNFHLLVQEYEKDGGSIFGETWWLCPDGCLFLIEEVRV